MDAMSLETLLQAAQYIERSKEPATKVSSSTRDSPESEVSPDPRAGRTRLLSTSSVRSRTISGCSDSSEGRRIHGVSGSRELHNKLEKNRRAQLKECFDDLKEKVPSLVEKKASNLTILRGALRHIEHLKRKDSEYSDTYRKLQNRRRCQSELIAQLSADLLELNPNIDVSRILGDIADQRDDEETASDSTATADDVDAIVSDDDLEVEVVMDGLQPETPELYPPAQRALMPHTVTSESQHAVYQSASLPPADTLGTHFSHFSESSVPPKKRRFTLNSPTPVSEAPTPAYTRCPKPVTVTSLLSAPPMNCAPDVRPTQLLHNCVSTSTDKSAKTFTAPDAGLQTDHTPLLSVPAVTVTSQSALPVLAPATQNPAPTVVAAQLIPSSMLQSLGQLMPKTLQCTPQLLSQMTQLIDPAQQKPVAPQLQLHPASPASAAPLPAAASAVRQVISSPVLATAVTSKQVTPGAVLSGTQLSQLLSPRDLGLTVRSPTLTPAQRASRAPLVTSVPQVRTVPAAQLVPLAAPQKPARPGLSGAPTVAPHTPLQLVSPMTLLAPLGAQLKSVASPALIAHPGQPSVLLPAQLPGGLSQLPGGLSQLPGGLSQLPGGLSQLPGGLSQLPGGLSQLPGGLSQLMVVNLANTPSVSTTSS